MGSLFTPWENNGDIARDKRAKAIKNLFTIK